LLQIIPYETTTSPFQKFQIQRAFSGVVFFGFSEVFNEKLYFEKKKIRMVDCLLFQSCFEVEPSILF
jgi:hypothetical protein